MTRKTTKSGSISRRRLLTTVSAGAALAVSPFRINLLQAQEAAIKIGFPVPLTGPYGAEAQDQVRAAQVAVSQFNDGGGLDGRKAELIVRDDKLNPGEAATRTLELVEKEKVNFVVGSLSAAVQLAVNNVTKERGVIFNSISQSDAINEAADFSKYTFHEALNPHMTSGAVGRYAFPKFGKKVAFLSADYAYGHEMVHGFLQALKPDILCICNFGRDQQISLKQATDFGVKKTTQIIAPLLTHAGRVAAGPQAYDGVIGGCSFYWGLEDKFASTKAFNEAFRKMYDGKLPTDYGALGYGGVRTILAAVKNAGSVDTDKVIAALEALKYDFYKGPQYYRKCDHQSVQSVLVIQSKSKELRNESDVFEIIATDGPNEANLRSCEELGHKA